MNTRADVESSVGSAMTAPPEIRWTHRIYWLLLREIWENRSIYIAPLVAAGVVLFGFLLSLITLPHRMRAVSFDTAKQRALLEQSYEVAAGMIMVTAFVVGVFYCLEALHSERRDRSILFWKSLPVSDLETVLAKVSIPILVLPLIAFMFVIATQWIMLLLNSAVLLASGQPLATLWSLPLFQRALMWVYHIVTVHGLWYAPFYGWLLLVSAWARRAPILWAILPPLAIGFVEKIAFNTSNFGMFMMDRLGGGPAGGDPLAMPGSVSMDLLSELTPGRFITSPGLWIGFAVTAIFLALAVRLRRYQGPI
jgi:ABC-2 type transport system permease protein